MRLDPSKVRYVSPMMQAGIFSTPLRMVGKQNTVALLETSLVFEGNVLKIGVLGMELLFRAALAEWTSVTVPYSRIVKAKYVRFPVARLFALLLAIAVVAIGALALSQSPEAVVPVAFVGGGLLVLCLYMIVRIPPRFVLSFRSKAGRKTVLQFRVLDADLRRRFQDKLAEYRLSATGFGWKGAKHVVR